MKLIILDHRREVQNTEDVLMNLAVFVIAMSLNEYEMFVLKL